MFIEPRVCNLKFCITFDKTSVYTKSLEVCDLLQSSWIPDYRYKLNHTFFSIEHKPFLSFHRIKMKDLNERWNVFDNVETKLTLISISLCKGFWWALRKENKI